MAKGNKAKENLMNRMIEALKDSYVGTEDGKKFYFTSEEDGMPMQVCVSMTCPKTPFEGSLSAGGGTPSSTTVASSTPTGLSEEDRRKIDALKAKLGIVD